MLQQGMLGGITAVQQEAWYRQNSQIKILYQ
jgi:hypothetical protein